MGFVGHLFFHPACCFSISSQAKVVFLCAVTPFVFISFFTDWQWKQLINHSYGLKFKTLFLTGVFLYSFYYISNFTYRVYTKRNNHSQKELIGTLNAFYKNTEPLIAIFDPFCILYSRKTDCRYVLDDEHWEKIFQSYLKKHNFDVILGSRFLDLFKLIYYKQSSFQYVNIKNHIYYKAFIVDSSNRQKILEKEESNNHVSDSSDISLQNNQELTAIKSTIIPTHNTDISKKQILRQTTLFLFCKVNQNKYTKELETRQKFGNIKFFKWKNSIEVSFIIFGNKSP